MTTYYVDPEGGNDGNAGTSFATRKKTLAAVTAALLAAGDTIRIIASRDPGSMGQNGTWTNGSKTVTLASAVNATIENCESAWTASANVTCTLNTTALRKRSGNASGVANISIAAGFTTGLVAFKQLGATLDLSTYQQVSLWFMSSTANVAGSLELRLCTDTAGVTGVHTIPLTEQALTAGSWRVAIKDFASNMNAAIRSIAIYAISDPGTTVLQIQNIVACKTAFGSDTLTHLSLVKPASGSEWYPINAISGTTISLGNCNTSDFNGASNVIPRNYNGSTVTEAIHKLQPLDLINAGGTAPPGTATNRLVQDSGTLGSVITISGGWDRTAMSSQSGETWMTASHYGGGCLDVGVQDYLNVSNIGLAHATSIALGIATGATGIQLDLLGIVGCAVAIQPTGAVSDYVDIDIDYINCCGDIPVNLVNLSAVDWTLDIGKVLHCIGANGLIATATGSGFIGRLRVPDVSGNGGFPVSLSANNGKLTACDIVAANNGVSGLFSASAAGGENLFIDCSPASSVTGTTIATTGNSVKAQNDGQDATKHWSIGYYFCFMSQAATRHTASGLAWKLSVGHATNRHAKKPVEVPVGHYYATAGVPITIKCWMQRSSTSLNCGIRVKGGASLGIPADVDGAMTAAINTWEEVSLTVTPTIDGCIEVIGYAYGAVADCFYDDLSVTT